MKYTKTKLQKLHSFQEKRRSVEINLINHIFFVWLIELKNAFINY